LEKEHLLLFPVVQLFSFFFSGFGPSPVDLFLFGPTVQVFFLSGGVSPVLSLEVFLGEFIFRLFSAFALLASPFQPFLFPPSLPLTLGMILASSCTESRVLSPPLAFSLLFLPSSFFV